MSIQSLAITIAVVTVAVFSLLGILAIDRRSLDVEEYIVSRNSVGSGMAIATIVASVVGAWLLLSPAETGVRDGLPGIVGYAIGQAAPLVAFAYLGPRLRQVMPQGHSLTEYAWYRFGAATYTFVVAIALFYMFVFLAAELTGIAQALQLVADMPLLATALLVAIATLAYTAYGGLRATMVTDQLQFWLIVPLLLITAAVTTAKLGGIRAALAPVATKTPELLSPTYLPGMEFGATLVIAILAANMFHQGFWQRVFACRDDRVLRRSFWIAGWVTIPLIAIAGLMGTMAAGHGVPTEQASVALFVLVREVLPPWALMLLLVLALALVMSSIDTLLNGIASMATSDFARWRPDLSTAQLLQISRLVTVGVSLPAIWIAAQGYSVLYLFLIADLVCSGALFPIFFGLYSQRLTGTTALISSIAGIAVGFLFFPKPDFSPWLPIPLAGHFLASFGAALVASTLLAVVGAQLNRSEQSVYDFGTLQRQVRVLER
jgi:Na+/proline symporter